MKANQDELLFVTLSTVEEETISGGGWIRKAWEWIKDHVEPTFNGWKPNGLRVTFRF